MRSERFFDRFTLSLPDDWTSEPADDGRIACSGPEGGLELLLDYQDIAPPQPLPAAQLIEAARGFAGSLSDNAAEQGAADRQLDELPDGALLRYGTTETSDEGDSASVRWWHRFGGKEGRVYLISAQLISPPGANPSQALQLAFSLNKELVAV